MSLLIRLPLLAGILATGLVQAAADPHSSAEPDKVRITALALDLAVSFERKELAGSAELSLDWHDKAARELHLDTRDLSISKVQALDAKGKATDVKFQLAERDAVLGSPLTISLPQQSAKVRILYKTSPLASGLQWLEPAQTAGKQQPFMFSQSEAIHARSWVPLQDTPGVRFTYTAHITVPKALRAAMSADNDTAHPLNGDFRFSMKQAIPSYLLAIAVGDLAAKATGPRSAIYAEPSTVDKAAAEFADTETMIATAEKLYGAYRWGRYDILVLPPSFPFGGMENPRLTFATPTVIVGDKSLVSLVAHELAHSWSGNLVTNSSWKDIWLNEGFTSYVEHRLTEALYGCEQADMEAVIGQFGLRKEMADMPVADQVLALPPLTGRDPDEGLSDVAYIKGAWFLSFLEQRVGRENFDTFLRGYFDHFAFQSIDTDQFVAYATKNLLEKYPGKVSDAEFKAWLHEPGIPAFATAATSARFDAVDKTRAAWLAGTAKAASL
ncbi:MAG: M1 family aminopeptidase/hydrolase, partial [Tahibacter sp.]